MPPYCYPAGAAELAVARDFYADRPVLVLGADGFLGRNLVEALLQLDARITVLTRRPQPRKDHPSIRVIKCDLADPENVGRALAGQDVVFNFAGGSGAVQSNREPLRSLELECLPQANLVQCCIEGDTRPLIVFCSTRLVYGRPRYLPVDEAHPVNPQSVYAVHKLTVEHYLELASEVHGLGYCIIRLSNPYGPYQPADSRGYGVINQFIERAARGQRIQIYGDGAQRRDYVFVDDVTTAFLLSAATPSCRNRIFNLGGTQSLSVAKAARIVARLAGAPPPELIPWPEESARVETGDYQTGMAHLRERLDLPAQVPFDDGVQRTLRYYRSAVDNDS